MLENEVVDVVDNIETMLVMKALTGARTIQVKYYEESNRIVIYIDGDEHFSIYFIRDTIDLVAVSNEARQRLFHVGHKSIVFTTRDIQWVYAILRRMFK